MKKQKVVKTCKSNTKGITLIVLIITIIVMLILAGVTINMVVGDKGVLQQAQTAGERQKYATAKEAILTQMEYLYEGKNAGKVNLDNTLSNINKLNLEEIQSTGWTDNSHNSISVKFKNGKEIVIDNLGNITENEDKIINDFDSSNENEEKNPINESLSTYILSSKGKGRRVSEIFDMSTGSFIVDPDNPEANVYQGVEFMGVDEDENEVFETVYIRYEGKIYYSPLKLENGEYYTTDLFILNTHIGEEVTYGEHNYIIIGENPDDGTVEMVSKNALGSDFVLCDDNDFEKTVNDYNNALEIIITACKNATGLTIDGTKVIEIRSVGNFKARYTSSGYVNESYGYVTSTYLDENTSYSKSINDWFEIYDKYHFENGDEAYENDINILKTLNILGTNDNKEYWIASRMVDIEDYSGEVHGIDFYLRSIQNVPGHGADVVGQTIIKMSENDCTTYDMGGFYVRPVVTVKASEFGWTLE